jgi:hypothetical protein
MWNCGCGAAKPGLRVAISWFFGVNPGVESRKSLFFGVDPGEGVGEIAKIAEIENLTHQGFQKNV